MPNRMKTIIVAGFILIGGGIYLGPPPVGAAVPCDLTIEDVVELTSNFTSALCSSHAGYCAFACSGGEITGASCHCF